MKRNEIQGRSVTLRGSGGAGRLRRGLFLGAIWALPLVLLLGMPAWAVGQTHILTGHVPAAEKDSQRIGDLAPSTRLNLALGLPLRNQAALTNLLEQLYNPASPQYHQYLSPEQFTAQFGPTEQEYQTVTAFAQTNGFQVTGTHPNRMLLNVNATAAEIEAAFHVTLGRYQHPVESREFYAPDVEPSVDASLPLLLISGLNNYSLPTPRLSATLLTNAPQVVAPLGSGPAGTYIGKDFRAAYLPDSPLTGAGQTVGLLEYDGYAASDISLYTTLAGLSSVTLSNVLLDSFSGLPVSWGGQLEVSLDIEVAIAMAPGLAQVIVYEENPYVGNWHNVLNRMATDNLAKQLSCSWYAPGAGADALADQIFQQMAAQGQSFFNASGDSDAYTGLIPFPGDTPYITQVGGTQLTTTGPGGGWLSEAVWNEGTGTGSGGGISTSYPIPSWQANLSMTANQGSTVLRNTPDVALTATNVFVVSGNFGYTVRGTSCSAPLWAGFAALANQQAGLSGGPAIGFINPAIYALGQQTNAALCLHDISTGDNTSQSSPSRFFAVAGYDLCTGWGTPAGKRLLNALAPPAPPMFQAVAQTGPAVQLSWSSLPGQNYQLLYRTNLFQSSWASLGTPILASNLTVSASDTPSPDVARFYRVMLLP